MGGDEIEALRKLMGEILNREVFTYEIDDTGAHLWWISFSGEHGFNGAVIVEAMNKIDALAEVTLAGINPGGEAKIVYIPPSEHWRIKPDEKYRLLSREEALSFDGRRKP